MVIYPPFRVIFLTGTWTTCWHSLFHQGKVDWSSPGAEDHTGWQWGLRVWELPRAHGGGCEGITPQNARRYLAMVEIILSEVRKRLFCMIFSSWISKIPFLFLGRFPNERSREFSTLGRSKSPMWSSDSMGPLGPDLREMFCPFSTKEPWFWKEGDFGTSILTLPGWIIFDIYIYNINYIFIHTGYSGVYLDDIC